MRRLWLGRQRQLVSHAAVDGEFISFQPSQPAHVRASAQRSADRPSPNGLGSAGGTPKPSALAPLELARRTNPRVARGRIRSRSHSATSFLSAPPLSRRHGVLLLRSQRSGDPGVRWSWRGADGLVLSRHRSLHSPAASLATAALARLVLLRDDGISRLGSQRRRGQADGAGAVWPP